MKVPTLSSITKPFRLRHLAGLSLLTGCVLALPAAALPGLQPGETCKDRPSFTSRSFDTDLVELTVTAPAAGTYTLWITYPATLVAQQKIRMMNLGQREVTRLQEQLRAPICASTSAAQTSCSAVRATTDPATNTLELAGWSIEDSASIGLKIHRRQVLQSGGFVGVRWKTRDAYTASECMRRSEGTALVRVVEKHRLAFDLGTVASLLSEDGNWDVEPELAMSARSEWNAWFLGSVSIRYSAIAGQEDSGTPEPMEEPESDTEGMMSSPQTMPGMEMEGDEDEFDPFEDGGGVLELWVDGVLRLPERSWLGVGGGLGFSSIPGEAGSDLELAERWRAGVRFQTVGYNAGEPGDSLANSHGFVMFGLMDDELWDTVTIDDSISDESRRWFVEAELELPQIGGDTARALARFWASLPESGDGPGEVRISFLATFDPSNWFPNS